MTAEWYLSKITDDQVDQCSGGDGEPQPGNFDSHEGWSEDGDSPAQEAANQMAKERLKQAMKEAAKEASQSPKGWGTMSAADAPV